MALLSFITNTYYAYLKRLYNAFTNNFKIQLIFTFSMKLSTLINKKKNFSLIFSLKFERF